MKKMIMVVMMVVMTGIFYSSMAHAEAEYACYESSHAEFITGDGWIHVSEFLQLLDNEVPGGVVILIQIDGKFYIKACNNPAMVLNLFNAAGVSLLNASPVASNASADEIYNMTYEGVFMFLKVEDGKYSVMNVR